MPKFSVIIASVNGLPTISECLQAIGQQRGNFNFETIVVDSTKDDTANHIKEYFPDVKLIELDTRPGIPEMRAIGMRESTGDYLVVTEDHCLAPENWLEQFRIAHESGYEIVGGAVDNGCTDRLLDWAAFLCEYSGFMPPITSGEAEFVAGNNVSYNRKLIDEIDITIKNDYWEYFLQRELRNRNVNFLSVPSIVVIHKKEFGFFDFMSQRFHYSRSFAAMRRNVSTVTQMIIYLVYLPISPLHLTWRIVRNVLKKKKYRRELLLSFPFLVIFMCCYAVGEIIGHLFGPGNSLAKVE